MSQAESEQGTHPTSQHGGVPPNPQAHAHKRDKAKAIFSLMLLKEKRDKSIKGEFCANGRKQQEDWKKQDSTSPTVVMELVF